MTRLYSLLISKAWSNGWNDQTKIQYHKSLKIKIDCADYTGYPLIHVYSIDGTCIYFHPNKDEDYSNKPGIVEWYHEFPTRDHLFNIIGNPIHAHLVITHAGFNYMREKIHITFKLREPSSKIKRAANM